MQVIEIEFTARQFHATPWDAHVNEGRIEWPPCPWRLLRALIAVGYSKLDWQSDPPDKAIAMLYKLAACRPRFGLPVSVETHSRHYMPVIEGKNERRAKLFDTFLRFPSDQNRMRVVFDCELSEEERTLLKELVDGLAYLGRAESWIDAQLLDTSDELESDNVSFYWSQPADQTTTKDRVRLLAPMDVDSFAQWREEATAVATQSAVASAEASAKEKGKALSPVAKAKAIAAATEPFPIDLIQALQNDTSNWQKQGWQRPPGSQWIDYEMSRDAYIQQPLKLTPQRSQAKNPTAILLAIDGEGKHGTLRPEMRRALPLMELLHAKSVWCAEKKLNVNLETLSELTGMNVQRQPLQGSHDHAHWIPLSLFDDRHIDHVLVYAFRGFSRESVRAIGQLRTAYSKGISKLAINLVGQGSISEIYQQLLRVSGVRPTSLAILRPSNVFESVTPLVFRKFLSSHGKKLPENQIREELIERGLPEPVAVNFWPSEELVNRKLKGFVLRRHASKRQPPFERSYGLTIEFPETVATVPFALGYASHYGLGLFQARQSH
ncbi:MAG: type I-U CRISPR-associated protein Csb2 [Pirellula sp.]